MTEQVQSRRGTTAQHATFAGAVGEITVDTDKDVPVVHDGATLGGFPSPGLKVAQTWTGAQAFTDASFTNAPTGAGITALFATLPGPVGTSGSAQNIRGATGTFTGQLDISGAAAGQIVFPATQNPSANANTLDDYEEGTWTPVATYATPGDLAAVFNLQTGYYTKIGNRVFLDCCTSSTTWTFTTASGALQITGLPFAAVNDSNVLFQGNMTFNNITKAGYSVFAPNIQGTTSLISIVASGSGVGASSVTAANMSSGTQILFRLSIVYRV